MNLLVLGGTRFVGRALVENALARGHVITIVHRGKSGEGLFDGKVETVHADRLENLDDLKGKRWDACIDTCGYVPRAIRIAGEALAGSVDHYTFISTISIYKDPAAGSDESAPVFTEGDPLNEEITGETYGYLKVLCEDEAIRHFGPETQIVRPSLVVGPHDPSDRFTYWVARIAECPKLVVPSWPDMPAQWIDARDLAEFTMNGVEQKRSGAYHVLGPERSITFQQTIEGIRDAIGSSTTFVAKDIVELGLTPWTDLPFVSGPDDGAFRLDPTKAIKAGLTYRSLADTARDTLAWWKEQGRELKTGISAARHADLTA